MTGHPFRAPVQKPFDPPDWRTRSACQDPDLFLSDDPADIAAAQQICMDCPVFAECQEYAHLTRPSAGVWAGRDCNDRRRR